jgi:hypothetical protein
MYLSCIATAEGTHLDKTYLDPLHNRERISEWRFAREEPTKSDWKLWKDFWKGYCSWHLELPSKLGRWEKPGHRIWPWLLDEEHNIIYRQTCRSIYTYTLLIQGQTQSSNFYIYLGEVNIISMKVIPISVDKMESDVVKIKKGGGNLPRLRQETRKFWDLLYEEGGKWMWDYVSDRISEPSWIPRALKQGTVILATDRSYNRKRGPNISGAGWVIACQKSGKMIKGSFYEFSSNARSYRGELLGLVAIHTLILHVCRFY